VQRSILKGGEQQAYICFRRGQDEDPIGAIRVLYGEDHPGIGHTQTNMRSLTSCPFVCVEQGFEKLDKCLLPTGSDVFLAFKRVSKGTLLVLRLRMLADVRNQMLRPSGQHTI
jgi:hypothetical protein